MNKTKKTFVLGFAIFAAFFGAGNLILPPMLGMTAGQSWQLVSLGFFCSAVFIPFLALIGHSRLQGTMMEFGKKVSPLFALVFSVCLYLIAIILPVPRTAAVTHEMAIQPFFEVSSLLTSSVYFALVFLFAVNRGTVLDMLGKFLTPIIGIILLLIIIIGVAGPETQVNNNLLDLPVVFGFLEGYQTYDAIAGLVMGGVEVLGVSHVDGIEGPGERVGSLGYADIENVIRHKAVGPDVEGVAVCVEGEPGEVAAVVLRGVEDGTAVIPPLGNLVRVRGDDWSG